MTKTTSRRAVLPKAKSVIDHAAALARAELMIDCLRRFHICEGWTVDQNECERILDYFRSSTNEMPGFVVRFFREHEQSLDWVLLGDVGALICRAASHSPRALRRAA